MKYLLRAISAASLILGVTSFGALATAAEPVDLKNATVVIRGGELPSAEKIAPVILVEEVAKRAGVTWKVSEKWPDGAGAIIALSNKSAPPEWTSQVAAETSDVLSKPEGFTIRVTAAKDGKPAIVSITGADPRGVMFGVGKLLRSLDCRKEAISLSSEFSAAESPDRPIRGHQVGYRPTANSWDAWTVEQFDQYFRELAIFGANAVEAIPFHEEPNALMRYDRKEMNAKLGDICEKYDLDQWAWIPIEFELPDETKGPAFLAQMDEYFKSSKRLDAIFIPGGDPGDNLAKNLIPYCEQIAATLRKYHPQSKVWISLQRPHPGDVQFFFDYLNNQKPDWFGGAVMGPSGPRMEFTRQKLPKQYQLRWYPDITHVVRCQYPFPWIDPAWGVTLGREPVNPRPVDYRAIYRNDYRFTDGFISYSDGIHDDFNKNLWTQLGWDPNRPVRDIAADYARFFFRSDLAAEGGDAIMSLETNLRGSMANNGSIDGSLIRWQALEKELSGSKTHWQFDMHLFRAYYDGYTHARMLYEAELETLALTKLGEAGQIGVEKALAEAKEILERATSQPVKKEWLDKLDAMAEHLFQTIGYQTSVPKYQARGSERGAVMDFVNYPLNNRWWLEDEFDRIAKMTDKDAQLKRIDEIRNWENPGKGGYYDVIGHVAKSPHMVKLLDAGDAMIHEQDIPMPTQRSMGPQRRGIRFAWHTYHDSIPTPLVYNALDPQARYTIKLFAQQESPLEIDGTRAKLIRKGETYDQVTEQEFEVPAEALADGKISLSWAKLDQRHLNWRQYHYVTDIWVIRH